MTYNNHEEHYYYTIHILIGVAVRLVGGSSYYEGRVELYYNGEWGTVCDDGWSSTDAGVVCKQLGLGTYGSSRNYAYYGQGSGPIWLDNVYCTGSESTITSCGHLGFNVTRSCSHREDAGVWCYGTRGIALLKYINSYFIHQHCMNHRDILSIIT